MNATIAFIGGGNMAASLVGGLYNSGTPADNILVAEPDPDKNSQLQSRFNVTTTTDNLDCLQQDIVILAVKPQTLQQVCEQLAPSLDINAPAFISIAAGVRSDSIDGWLGGGQAIVRCMPNTPALLRCGATGLYANAAVKDHIRTLADSILSSVGVTSWVEQEHLLDSITAVSGSGPAYFFLMMEAMQQAAVELGLDAHAAERLVTQTALGAARMMAEGETDAATLRRNVTSKGGTTEQAILSFEQSGFTEMVKQALKAAHDRSISLAEELATGKDDAN